MRLVLETNIDVRPIAISGEQEPFQQIRHELAALPHAVWAERFKCDVEARVWIDLWALKLTTREMGVMRTSPTDARLCAVFCGIPIEMEEVACA